MTEPDYNMMSNSELLTYVRQHPEDNEAFYAFVDRKRAASPNAVPMTVEQAEIELEQRINQRSQ